MARRLAALSLLVLVVTAVASGAGGANGAGEFTFYPRRGSSGATSIRTTSSTSEAYARDLALSAKPMSGKRDLPYDHAVRTGTFVRGTKVVYSRIEIGAMPPPGAGVLRVRFVRPSGSIAADSRMTLQTAHGRGYWWFANRVTLGRLGRWRIVIDLDGRTLADSPVDVVARQADVRNRPPSAISVSLRPETPTARGVVECLVSTSLVAEDPDYDIVRYRYRWFVDGKLVRRCRAPRSRTCFGRVLLGPGRACAARSLRVTAACRGRPQQLRRRRASQPRSWRRPPRRNRAWPQAVGEGDQL